MPHTELTKQAKDLIYYHNFLLRGAGFNPTKQPGCVIWLDIPSIDTNITEDPSFNISNWANLGTGADFPQATGANQPVRTGASDFIEFNGTAHFLEGTASDVSGDLQGELFMVVDGDEGTSGMARPLVGAASAQAAVHQSFGYDFNIRSNSIAIQNQGAAINDFVDGSSDVNGTGFNLLNHSSNGTTWRAFVNGVEETLDIVAGANAGRWFGDLTTAMDTITLFLKNNSVQVFQKGKIKTLVYYNTQRTVAQRLQVSRYINARTQLGLAI